MEKTVTISDRISIFLEKKFRYSKSFSTKKTYDTSLKRFQEFLRTKYNLDIDQVLIQFEKGLNPIDVLDDYYTFLSKGKFSNLTIKQYVGIAKDFLNAQGLHIYNEDVKQKFKLPKRDKVYEKGLTKEIIIRILQNSSPKLQTVILICVSSGMRLGELVQLKLSDIDFETNPTTIQLRKETTKTRETRFTCLTSEATKSLKDYLTRSFAWSEGSTKQKDRYIFLQTYGERLRKLKTHLENSIEEKEKARLAKRIKEVEAKYENLSEEERHSKSVFNTKSTLEEMLSKVTRSIPDLSGKNENGRNSIHYNSFRYWFKTQVTDAHQSDFAEALEGHTSVKLAYYKQNDRARAKTYLSVEHALTIMDSEKIDKNFSEIQEKNQDLQKQIDGLKGLFNNLLKNQVTNT